MLLSLISSSLRSSARDVLLSSNDSIDSTQDISLSIQDLDFNRYDISSTVVDLYTVQQTPDTVVISLSADVFFDFDRSTLKPIAVNSLEHVVKRISELPNGKVRIEGHTDAKGSKEYNKQLSLKRASSVRDWLVSEGGIANREFIIFGLGESRPVAPNLTEDGDDDPVGRQKNRRVEIVINRFRKD